MNFDRDYLEAHRAAQRGVEKRKEEGLPGWRIEASAPVRGDVEGPG